MRKLEDLSKEELLEFIKEYNNYVVDFYEEHDLGDIPVCVSEFYYNEYQFINDLKESE